MFYPFVYPEEWIKKRFCYYEVYALNAFLMKNQGYAIYYRNDFVVQRKNKRFFEVNHYLLKIEGAVSGLEKMEIGFL